MTRILGRSIFLDPCHPNLKWSPSHASNTPLNRSIACLLLASMIFAYTCVEMMFLCPSNLHTVYKSMPRASERVAKVWRPIWNIHGKANDSEQVKIKRKPLGISDISVFCQVGKMQKITEYWGCSVTKPLAGRLPKREQVTVSNEKKSSPFCLHSYTAFCVSRDAYMASKFALKNISVWK